MLALTLAVPAFALEESDVEAAVSSSSREAVAGNVLVWFLCAVGFLKVSQKIDSFMASIGVNVGHTGGSMLGEAMVAFKGVSLAAGMAGKVVGNFADRASSRAFIITSCIMTFHHFRNVSQLLYHAIEI